jgi:branched-chain amino acid transport system permease protein
MARFPSSQEQPASAAALRAGDDKEGATPRIAIDTTASRAFALAGCLLIVVLIGLPLVASRSLIQDFVFIFYMFTLAQFWNLLAGYAGLVSVGQQTFVGLGGYVLFALTVMAGLDPLISVLLAGIAAAVFAVPTAFIVFRLQGAYFAVGTWVMAEVYRLVVAQIKELGGGTGSSLPPEVTNSLVGIDWIRMALDLRTPAARDVLTYWIALAIAAGSVLTIYLVLRSRRGLALAAIRDSTMAAQSLGVDIFRTKLWIYVLVAAGTGMVGALIYLQKARISPDAAFSILDWTAYVIFIVVIGGIGTLEGPIIGVIIFYLMQTYLAGFGSWYLILLGALAIVTMLFAPKGIWGHFSQSFGVVLFPVQRRVSNSTPALVAESGRSGARNVDRSPVPGSVPLQVRCRHRTFPILRRQSGPTEPS